MCAADGLARARALRDGGDIRGAVRLAREHAAGRAAEASDLLADCAVDLAREIGGNPSVAALNEIEKICDDAYRLATSKRRRDDIAGVRAAVRQTRANLDAPAPSPRDRQRFVEGFKRRIAPDIAAGRESDAIRAGRAWLAQERDPAIRAQIIQFLGPYAASDDPNTAVVNPRLGAAPRSGRKAGSVALMLVLGAAVGAVGWFAFSPTAGVVAAAIVLTVAVMLVVG